MATRRKAKWEWPTKNDPRLGPPTFYRSQEVSDQQVVWRLRGYLDCLRALAVDGPPDPKYVEWLCDRVGEPLVSLSYVEKLRRLLGAEAAEQQRE